MPVAEGVARAVAEALVTFTPAGVLLASVQLRDSGGAYSNLMSE